MLDRRAGRMSGGIESSKQTQNNKHFKKYIEKVGKIKKNKNKKDNLRGMIKVKWLGWGLGVDEEWGGGGGE